MNQEIGESGQLRDSSSITFALSLTKQKKSWLYELSYLIRSMLIDHPFVDGNKRTAYILCCLYFEDHQFSFQDELLVKTVHVIAKKNIQDINKIGRMILKCLMNND